MRVKVSSFEDEESNIRGSLRNCKMVTVHMSGNVFWN